MTEQQARDNAATEAIEAVVTDIRLESRIGAAARWQVALDRNVFPIAKDAAAASRLEPSAASPIGVLEAVARSGARLEVAVIEVVEQDGVTWCVVDKPLLEGTVVRVRAGQHQRSGRG